MDKHEVVVEEQVTQSETKRARELEARYIELLEKRIAALETLEAEQKTLVSGVTLMAPRD